MSASQLTALSINITDKLKKGKNVIAVCYYNAFHTKAHPQEKFYLPESYLKDENQITLLIEGPGFHPVKQFGFIPPYFKELELDYFYRSKKIKIEVKYI